MKEVDDLEHREAYFLPNLALKLALKSITLRTIWESQQISLH